jgi:hypothetical protein
MSCAKDACAGRVDLCDAPQFQQQGFRVSGFGIYELRQPVGGTKEQRALQLDRWDGAALSVQDLCGGVNAVARMKQAGLARRQINDAPLLRSLRDASRSALKLPLRLIATWLSSRASSLSARLANRMIPALLTSTSTPPNAASATAFSDASVGLGIGDRPPLPRFHEAVTLSC